jgi:ATP-dependent helicase/nuclease subunit B
LIDNFFKEEQIPKIFSEERGSMTLETDVGPFTINCKADLLSVRGQHLNIIDFKTGQVPTATSIKRGLAPQLTLEAMVAQSGGFSNIAFKPTLSETTLCYVHLTGGVPAGKIYKIEADVELLVQEARKGLLKLLNVFEQESTPYLYCPNPSIAPKYNDYVHLSRIKGG